MLIRRLKMTVPISYRSHKNFGHKRQPIPIVTFLWQGFLSFTFIGMCIEWKRFAQLMFGEKGEEPLTQITGNAHKK